MCKNSIALGQHHFGTFHGRHDLKLIDTGKQLFSVCSGQCLWRSGTHLQCRITENHPGTHSLQALGRSGRINIMHLSQTVEDDTSIGALHWSIFSPSQQSDHLILAAHRRIPRLAHGGHYRADRTRRLTILRGAQPSLGKTSLVHITTIQTSC